MLAINSLTITNNHTAQDTIEGSVIVLASPLYTQVLFATQNEEIIQYLQGGETHLKIPNFPNLDGQYEIEKFDIVGNTAHVIFIKINTPLKTEEINPIE